MRPFVCSLRSGSLGARHALLVEQVLHNVCCGATGPATPDAVAFSTAAYAARDPCRDIHILGVRHRALAMYCLIFPLVRTCTP